MILNIEVTSWAILELRYLSWNFECFSPKHFFSFLNFFTTLLLQKFALERIDTTCNFQNNEFRWITKSSTNTIAFKSQFLIKSNLQLKLSLFLVTLHYYARKIEKSNGINPVAIFILLWFLVLYFFRRISGAFLM